MDACKPLRLENGCVPTRDSIPRTIATLPPPMCAPAETATLLNLPNARWRRLNRLRERSAGDWEHVSAPDRRRLLAAYPVKHYELDPYNWPPPNGETLAEVEERRVSLFLDTLHRKCAHRKVVVVCHGEVLLVFRVLLERMTDENFRLLYGSKNPHDRMHNGIIIHYTRRSPFEPKRQPGALPQLDADNLSVGSEPLFQRVAHHLSQDILQRGTS